MVMGERETELSFFLHTFLFWNVLKEIYFNIENANIRELSYKEWATIYSVFLCGMDDLDKGVRSRDEETCAVRLRCSSGDDPSYSSSQLDRVTGWASLVNLWNCIAVVNCTNILSFLRWWWNGWHLHYREKSCESQVQEHRKEVSYIPPANVFAEPPRCETPSAHGTIVSKPNHICGFIKLHKKSTLFFPNSESSV